MKKEHFGCACCNGTFGKLFYRSKPIQDMKAAAANEKGWSCNWGMDWAGVGRRDVLKGGLAAAGFVATMPNAVLAQAEATIVFKGGTILTVDADFSVAEALAIRGNKILAVGSEDTVVETAGAGAKVIDLEGRTVLPGFIDAHTHVVSGSVVDSIMDYVGMARFATAAQVLEHIASRVAETPAGEWLAFRNFDPAVQDGPDALTFRELDAASGEHPIFVLNASGHLAYANSKAFEAAGIGEDIENPEGGEFVRDENGNLNGTMKNNVAFLQVVGSYPAMASVDPFEDLIRLLDNWSAKGLTTVSELSLGALAQSPADAQVMAAAAQSGRLSARIRAYPFYTLGADVWDAAGIVPNDGTALARIAGYKLVADGSNQGFTGLQREPYLDSDDRGLAYMQPDELKAIALERAEKGWPLAIHGNGDAAIDNILDTYEALREAGIDLSKVRPRIEHCSILHDDQIARMKDLGVSASFLIGHVHFWGVAMRDNVFGAEKAQLLDRCQELAREI